MRFAVFLDRDGVLNKLVVRDGRSGSPHRLDEFELLPGVARAVEMLRRVGLLVVVVTNQPDIARGLLTPAELERIHACLCKLVSVEAIYTCPHDDQDGCSCRKPKPGLLLRASREWNISLPNSYLVGDSWKDIAAGQNVGCKTFLVKRGENDSAGCGADFVVPDVLAAAKMIADYTREAKQANPVPRKGCLAG